MLQAIRNRAQGIFAWVMLILVGVPFALWGINNYFDSGKEKPVAVVGDRDIFERDVNRAYENLVSRIGSGDYDEKQLRHEALERLISEELIAQNADDKALAVSESDVRGYVQSQAYFQTEGKFDKEKFKMMLAGQNMSSAQFTAQVGKQLITEQFVRGLTESAFVTQQQIESFYRLRNQERLIEYLALPPQKLEGDVQDKDIEAYYQENKKQFQNPERVAVEYLGISLDEVAATLQASEEDLRNQYEEQKAQYTVAERRKVSHILISAEMDKEDSVKAAQAKAEQVRDRIGKGEDFGKLAAEASDDKESAAKGGDLGYIKKETLDPNFATAAFALNAGEVSQPIKTAFGYHLIKVTELVPAAVKKFEEVREELAKNFQRSAAEAKFYDLGQKLTAQAFEHNESLESAAKALDLKVQQTDWFSREKGEGVAAEKSFRDAAFGQDVLDGKNSEPVEIGNEKVYVLRLKEHQEASDKLLPEVKQEIVEKLREKAGQEASRKQAEQVLAELKQGKVMVDEAKSLGVGLLKATVKRVGSSDLPPSLVSAVTKAQPPREGKPSFALTSGEKGEQIVFHLLEVKDGSTAAVDPKELEKAKDYLSKNAGEAEFDLFLKQLRVKSKVHILSQDRQ
ncbi:MAG: SurA N-terminal domain-containing protein [Methylococcaceae bacterium]|nr:SurA N-terminal domain-containing protein [Methylococcaceae bacterium]